MRCVTQCCQARGMYSLCAWEEGEARSPRKYAVTTDSGDEREGGRRGAVRSAARTGLDCHGARRHGAAQQSPQSVDPVHRGVGLALRARG